MKELVINTPKGEKTVMLKNPKGRDTKKGLKLLTSFQNEDGEENLSGLSNYLDWIDEISAEYTDMSVEELDDLDSDEKNKITGFYQSKVTESLDFLKSSLAPQSSVQNEKKA